VQAAGGTDIWDEDGTAHLLGTCRMRTAPDDGVINDDGLAWDVPNPWICDDSLFSKRNPFLTI